MSMLRLFMEISALGIACSLAIIAWVSHLHDKGDLVAAVRRNGERRRCIVCREYYNTTESDSPGDTDLFCSEGCSNLFDQMEK